MPSNQSHFKNKGKNKIATSLETADNSYAHKTIMNESCNITLTLLDRNEYTTNLVVQEESYFSISYECNELEIVTLVGLDMVQKRMFTRICWGFYSTGLYLFLPRSPAVIPVQSRIKGFFWFLFFFYFMQETRIVASKTAAIVLETKKAL